MGDEEVVFDLRDRVPYAGIIQFRFTGFSDLIGVSAAYAAPPAVIMHAFYHASKRKGNNPQVILLRERERLAIPSVTG